MLKKNKSRRPKSEFKKGSKINDNLKGEKIITRKMCINWIIHNSLKLLIKLNNINLNKE